jgi:drug/metabolite transporter (DMT)-like permease
VTLSVAFSPVLALSLLCLLGGAFAVAGAAVARRFGRSRVIPFWIVASACLGAVGASRTLAVQRSYGVDPARVSAVGTFALLIAAMAVIFSIPTFAMWKRATTVKEISVVRQSLAGIGWTCLGIILAVGIAVALDLANIPFVPVR